jgi:hypothetical protein
MSASTADTNDRDGWPPRTQKTSASPTRLSPRFALAVPRSRTAKCSNGAALQP